MKKLPPIKIAPSIFAADFGKLADEAKRAEDAGADMLHIDIMDGHFVPNLTLGPRACAAINRATNLFLDVHIMVYNPFDWVQRFIESGADRVTFHFEATEDVEDVLGYIKRCGIQAGLAFCPETSATMVNRYINQADLILLMTVHPGFGGQEFIPEVLEKIEYTRTLAPEGLDIQVDGGINDETALIARKAGANVFVAGTHLFNKPNMAEAIAKMRKLG